MQIPKTFTRRKHSRNLNHNVQDLFLKDLPLNERMRHSWPAGCGCLAGKLPSWSLMGVWLSFAQLPKHKYILFVPGGVASRRPGGLKENIHEYLHGYAHGGIFGIRRPPLWGHTALLRIRSCQSASLVSCPIAVQGLLAGDELLTVRPPWIGILPQRDKVQPI